MKKKYIKIISGKWKGKKINTIKHKYLKPTLVIIRKILFEWLKKYIKNKICLECFAGTAILSIESLSNKAKFTFILEKNYKIYNNIKKNLIQIKKKKYKLININSLIWIKKNSNIKFDIIFLDCPYNNKYILNKCINLIKKKKIIKYKGFIYIETYKNNKKIIKPKKWIIYKKKYIGNNKFYLFKNIYK